MSILVVAEHREGQLVETTLEAVAMARRVADASGTSVQAAVLGSAAVAETMRESAVDEVLLVEGEPVATYSPEGYAGALAALLKDREVALVLTAHTATGYEFLPRLAGELEKPCVTDAVGIAWEDGALLVTRMGYNGKVALELAIERPDPAFVTLRPGVVQAAEASGSEAPVTPVDLDLSTLSMHRRILGYEKPVTGDVDITEADVIVAAGRGIKEKENLSLVEDLAGALGGVVAGSRPLIDKEWLPWSRQVGSSGKTVRPKLYIACGISGAMQHVTGMKNAGTIVAINIDPTAPIFGIAHYGVVGDLFKVIPELLKALASG